MSTHCIDCGNIKKSNKGDRCRTCSNIRTGKNIDRNIKLSKSKRGWSMSEESRKKISISSMERFKDKSNHPMFGRKHSKESIKKISDANKGKKNPQWKGGRIKTSNGYIWIHCPNNPMSNKCHPEGYVLEHRFVMSQKLGRYLTKNEVVHHINGIRDDNGIENLFLTQKGKHIAEHNHNRVWSEESKQKHRVKASKLKRNDKGMFIGY